MNLFKRHYLNDKGFPSDVSRPRGLNVLFWMVMVTALFLIQTNVSFFDMSLNLTVFLPFYFGLKRSPEKGLAMGIVVGIIEDSLGNTLLGPHILSKGMVGLLAPLLLGRVFVWTPMFGIVSLFSLSFFDAMVVYTCKSIFISPPALLKTALFSTIIQSIINAPVGYLIKPKYE